MVIRNAPLLVLLLFLVLPAARAAENRFAGCAGLSVTRTNDFSSVDVSKDLSRADQRIQQICEKVIPGKLKAIQANVKTCVAGANQEIGPGLAESMKQDVQVQMQGFQHRIQEACDSMKKTMQQAQSFCDDRKTKLDELSQEISPLEKSATSQADSQQKAADVYGKANAKYLELAAQAKAAEEKIYSYLPDKDENRARQKRKGNESASTRDFKTDRLIEHWKSSLELFSKGNKNKAACNKLAARNGELDDMGNVLKNNLWPNGKMAARAITRIEGEDQRKGQEFAKKKSEASTLVAASAMQPFQDKRERVSDISGTEIVPQGPKKLTQADLEELKKKDESAQELQAKAIKAYKESGATGPDAVNAAILQAKKTDELPADYQYVSAARAAVDENIVGAKAGSSAAPGSVEELKQALRSPASANIPETYTPPQVPCVTSVWSWSSMWWVDTVGLKNSAGECVVAN